MTREKEKGLTNGNMKARLLAFVLDIAASLLTQIPEHVVRPLRHGIDAWTEHGLDRDEVRAVVRVVGLDLVERERRVHAEAEKVEDGAQVAEVAHDHVSTRLL